MRILMVCCVLSVAASCVPKAWAPYGSGTRSSHHRASHIFVTRAEAAWVHQEMTMNRLVTHLETAGVPVEARKIDGGEKILLTLTLADGTKKYHMLNTFSQHHAPQSESHAMAVFLKEIGVFPRVVAAARQR